MNDMSDALGQIAIDSTSARTLEDSLRSSLPCPPRQTRRTCRAPSYAHATAVEEVKQLCRVCGSETLRSLLPRSQTKQPVDDRGHEKPNCRTMPAPYAVLERGVAQWLVRQGTSETSPENIDSLGASDPQPYYGDLGLGPPAGVPSTANLRGAQTLVGLSIALCIIVPIMVFLLGWSHQRELRKREARKKATLSILELWAPSPVEPCAKFCRAASATSSASCESDAPPSSPFSSSSRDSSTSGSPKEPRSYGSDWVKKMSQASVNTRPFWSQRSWGPDVEEKEPCDSKSSEEIFGDLDDSYMRFAHVSSKNKMRFVRSDSCVYGD